MYYSRKPLWGEIDFEGAIFFNTFAYNMNSRYFFNFHCKYIYVQNYTG